MIFAKFSVYVKFIQLNLNYYTTNEILFVHLARTVQFLLPKVRDLFKERKKLHDLRNMRVLIEENCSNNKPIFY